MSKIFIFFLLIFLSSCEQDGLNVKEENDSGFQRALSLLKVGNDEDALEEFLAVTRRTMHCPKSHLQVGMLFLNLESRKDPVAAIYHFQRFLLLENNSKEAPKVRQLIVTAEREIIRELPGEPYADYLDSLDLREQNNRLMREVADLKARLGLPLTERDIRDNEPPLPVRNSKVQQIKNEPSFVTPPLARTYVVQKGDSLYGISRKFYGDSSYIEQIFQANRNSLSSKDSLKLGQKLIIPAVSKP
ncbi:MAG: LysM peptidoglycan-binding domain-containing protein [Opitutae bacterium]|nr:LysM peptidoglycan-binding domain-containing protein [Opitutae bacterium]